MMATALVSSSHFSKLHISKNIPSQSYQKHLIMYHISMALIMFL